MQQGKTLPNGLIAINLPYMGTTWNLPQRLKDNIIRDGNNNDIGYARYYKYPSSKEELKGWIEDAHNS